jgi:hypothetical protein
VTAVLRRLRESPRVGAAGAVTARPFAHAGVGWDQGFFLEGQDPQASATNPLLNWQVVTPGFFEAMALPLLAGRGFEERDGPEAPPVVVIGRSLAERLWSTRVAVGRRLFTAGGRWDRETGEPLFQTVVGVVPDAHYREPDRSRLDVYVPARQAEVFAGTVVVRTVGQPSSFVPEVRALARAAAPGSAVTDLVTMDEVVRAVRSPWRVSASVLLLFGVASGLLAFVGLHGMLAYAVASRRAELAVRVALGASRRRIVGLVLGDGAGVVVVGVAAGAAIAVAGSGGLRHLLHDVSATDGTTYGVVTLLVAAVALLAMHGAARRASAAEPSAALRTE